MNHRAYGLPSATERLVFRWYHPPATHTAHHSPPICTRTRSAYPTSLSRLYTPQSSPICPNTAALVCVGGTVPGQTPGQVLALVQGHALAALAPSQAPGLPAALTQALALARAAGWRTVSWRQGSGETRL